MSDMYEDWPRVPVDPECIPRGWEPSHVAFPRRVDMEMLDQSNKIECVRVRLMLRRCESHIKLPSTIVPFGWWVFKQKSGKVLISMAQPTRFATLWAADCDDVWEVPSPIAMQLPKEYLDLPWDQSLLWQAGDCDAQAQA